MPRISVFFGVILIALGILGYMQQAKPSPADGSVVESNDGDSAESAVNTEKKRSLTAFIPSVFGVLIGVSGIIALNPDLRKHAMHAAVIFGLLGAVLGFGKGMMDLIKLFKGDPVNVTSMTFVWMMVLLCAAFVFLCIRSFIESKKRRIEAEANAATL